MGVVASHAAHGRFEVGVLGVDVFFAISGFIMWSVTWNRLVTPGAFLHDRVTRIAPPYLLLTLAMYVIATTVPGVFPHILTPVSHLVLSLLFVPHPDPYGTWYPLLVPGWTLIYEAGFYLLFAACLAVPKRHRFDTCICALILLATALGLPRLLEFGLGIAVARWAMPGVLALERHMPRWRLPVLLGNASYGIYLTHVFVVAACWRVLGPVSVPLTVGVALVGAALGGVIWWRWIEVPLTRFMRRLGTRRGAAPWTNPPPPAAAPPSFHRDPPQCSRSEISSCSSNSPGWAAKTPRRRHSRT